MLLLVGGGLSVVIEGLNRGLPKGIKSSGTVIIMSSSR